MSTVHTTRSETNSSAMTDQPKITTGDVSAPRNALTSGRRAWERREYRDFLVAVSYDDPDTSGGECVLVWDRKAGIRAGYLWFRGHSTEAAVEAFRAGERSSSELLQTPA